MQRLAYRSQRTFLISSKTLIRKPILWNSRFSAQNSKHISSVNLQTVPGDPPQADVLHKRKFGSRVFILNRPNVLNALDLSMVRNMTPQLQAWNESDLCKVIILKANGKKAFCAGGDVKRVVELAKREKSVVGGIRPLQFFEEEFQLNHLIATLDKPFVAFMDGITMGGGVGLSVHAPFRVATEKTAFAMPEINIGYFPDVGGSFFLSRMDGEVGTYLAMTGARLFGIDVFLSGIATHYVPSQRLPYLEDRLSELESDDHEVINAAIEDFVSEPEHNHIYSLGGVIREAIDRCFKGNTVEGIIDALNKEENKTWSKETINTLLKMSPTSLKVTLRELRKGKHMVITDCFKMEYKLVQRFLEKSDFIEGVTALLVDKREPQWNPSKLGDISDNEIEKFYFESSEKHHLNLLNKRSFENYPYSRFALPTEEEIRRVVTGETPDAGSVSMTQQEIVDYFLKDRKGKIGVREKVLEVLNRKTAQIDGQEGLKWLMNIK
ncbi:ClpP/crotonase-like domain-containing protein [Glomus cerebriforme]|uniref:3-hydroxyisobutyryl-CoA hydrolase n=1 Tax=Glomus cerebriforme TaxID=658196 RepID=A0A397SGT2_9GLOM|nr:ClpP/crotonase-like domain-containing protein [Glomus cerebriforme]